MSNKNGVLPILTIFFSLVLIIITMPIAYGYNGQVLFLDGLFGWFQNLFKSSTIPNISSNNENNQFKAEATSNLDLTGCKATSVSKGWFHMECDDGRVLWRNEITSKVINKEPQITAQQDYLVDQKAEKQRQVQESIDAANHKKVEMLNAKLEGKDFRELTTVPEFVECRKFNEEQKQGFIRGEIPSDDPRSYGWNPNNYGWIEVCKILNDGKVVHNSFKSGVNFPVMEINCEKTETYTPGMKPSGIVGHVLIDGAKNTITYKTVCQEDYDNFLNELFNERLYRNNKLL